MPPDDLKGAFSREELYAIVWSRPMVKVAEEFELSSTYLARVCRMLDVPRPDRGYWARRAAGQRPRRPPLPPLKPGGQAAWSRGGAEYLPRALPEAPTAPAKRASRKRPASGSSEDGGAARHPLIVGAKELFESDTRDQDRWRTVHLKPSKRALVDVVASRTGLDKALAFANALYRTLEGRGHRVMFAPSHERFGRPDVDVRNAPDRHPYAENLWRPSRGTVVYVGTVAIGLTVTETTEEALARLVKSRYVKVSELPPPKKTRYPAPEPWTTTHNFATGRLLLSAYSPYRLTDWSRQWRETERHDLTSMLASIVKDLECAAPEIASLYKEGLRKEEIRLREWAAAMEISRQREAERLAEEARAASLEDLKRTIAAWRETLDTRRFFELAAEQITKLSEADASPLRERLALAQEMIGPLDSLDRLRHWKTAAERLASKARGTND